MAFFPRQNTKPPVQVLTLSGLRAALGPLLGLVLLAGVIWRGRDVDWDAVAASLAQIGPVPVLAAFLFTGLSYLAAGQYDALVHRHLQLPYPLYAARRAGIAAIAISQTVGLGVVTGSLVRARLLPQISLARIVQVTVLVGGGFALSWAVLSAFSLLAYRGQWATAVLLLALVGLIWYRMRQVFSEKCPDMATFFGLLTYSALDCLMAGLSLLALCGGAGFADPALFLMVFLFAFGAGLMSGSPAGLGAFEMVFLTALSAQTDPTVLAGVILWRFVYFVGPALLAAVYGLSIPQMAVLEDLPVNSLVACPQSRAETAIGAQAGHRGLDLGAGLAWLAARPGRLLVGMFDPTDRRTPGLALQGLARRARAEGRVPIAYKVAGRLTAAARAKGWARLLVAREAVLDPTDFNLDTPARAGLRRKLRRAASAGLVIGTTRVSRDRDWHEIMEVSREWAVSHGGERGFSVGRVQRSYLAGQLVVTARQGGKLTAFASFHCNGSEWVLDILRHRDQLQDGTMHALIMGAIDLAAHASCTRLSLAAVPVTGFPDGPRNISRLAAAFGYQTGAGLAQFKQAFAPRWEPRYLIAPSRAAMVEALLVIITEVHRPARTNLLHHDDEEIGIASEEAACDTPLIQIDEVEDVVAIPVQCPVKAA